MTLHGVGTASDDTRTTLKLVGHAAVAPDDTVRVDFTRGGTQYGR